MLFRLLSFPILILGSVVILVWLLGIYGLICLALPLLLFPLQILIGKINGTIFKMIKALVDQRILLTK
jgi:hypothetical protein